MMAHILNETKTLEIAAQISESLKPRTFNKTRSPLNNYEVEDQQIFHHKNLYNQLSKMLYALTTFGTFH